MTSYRPLLGAVAAALALAACGGDDEGSNDLPAIAQLSAAQGRELPL